MAKRRIVANAIMNKIIELLDPNESLSFVKSISKGDLRHLPEPDKFKDFMPAIMIDLESVTNTFATPSKTITTSEYYFNIRYIKYYDQELTYVIKEQAIAEAEKIADILIDEGNFQIDSKDSSIRAKCLVKDENEGALGFILDAKLPFIQFNSVETTIFRNLELPVLVVEMEYFVTFRTLIR